jgi:ribosomal protein S18 acetylase RimI-like enzyme
LEETRHKGVRVLISLSVAKWNRPANALYEHHGVFALYERYGFTAVEEDGGALL